MPELKLFVEVFMLASIEAPFALLEELIEIVQFDTIESSQISLRHIP